MRQEGKIICAIKRLVAEKKRADDARQALQETERAMPGTIHRLIKTLQASGRSSAIWQGFLYTLVGEEYDQLEVSEFRGWLLDEIKVTAEQEEEEELEDQSAE